MSLKTPLYGSPERQGMNGRKLRHPRRRARMERRLLKEGRARLENMPGFDLSMFGTYALAAAAAEIVRGLARHGIGAARVRRVELRGDAAMVIVEWFAALDRIPGTVQGHGLTAWEISPVCLLAWRRPAREATPC